MNIMGPLRQQKSGLLLLAILALSLLIAGSVLAQEGTDPDVLEQGARLYLENCAVCHGDNGEGRVGATLAKDWPSIRPDLDTRNIIVNGVAGSFMPPWGKEKGGPLEDAEIDALVAYILTWQTGDSAPVFTFPTATPRPPIEPVPEVAGDPNSGAVLYDGNCALCHGLNGEGRVGATLAKDWPSIRPDLDVQNTIVSGVQGSYMPPWSQTNGGPLTETEINDLVAFVLSWSATNEETAVPPPTQAPTPTPEIPDRGNTGLILAVVALVVIIIGGVIWVSRSR
jgi:cytochrome c oxidase cbb3-type subunit 3/ubiquinol-cytochrome c reductase cytochrome c subunit